MNNVISVKLITHTYSTDSIGQRIPTDVEKTVFGYKDSISGSEVAEAGKRGIQAEFRVEVWSSEYNGADVVDIGGTKYAVYRTYENSRGKTELYLQKRVQP